MTVAQITVAIVSRARQAVARRLLVPGFGVCNGDDLGRIVAGKPARTWRTKAVVPARKTRWGVSAVRTILLVGDDCVSRERCRSFMTRCGSRVVVTKCAREALEMAAVVRPDLLIVDQDSPDVAGEKAAESVLFRYLGLPVIIRTDASGQKKSRCGWPVVAVVSRSHGLLRLRRAVARASARRITMVREEAAVGLPRTGRGDHDSSRGS